MTYGGISGESFSLDPDTGVLTTLRTLDREEQEEINLTGTHWQNIKILRCCKHQCNTGRTLTCLLETSIYYRQLLLYFWIPVGSEEFGRVQYELTSRLSPL